MSGVPTSDSIRTIVTECGIAYTPRGAGQRSLRSTLQTGKPSTWGRQAGTLYTAHSEVREMRNAATVLGIIQDRGKRGLPLEDIYRQLFNPALYLRAYAHLYPNKGALTPGATAETVDGMTLAKIEALIDDLRHERFRWTPV